MKRLRLLISGLVQGVNYRYYTELKADELGLSGWVKNLPDGRVEIEVLGSKEKLADFLSWCQQGPSSALVQDIKVEWSQADKIFNSFEIS